jgi:alkanesulfonate monooxygenase SsuD/methylene tetrahydromethanopterin reductase-like flavin-dependent oxidoreductase (luciferase family)
MRLGMFMQPLHHKGWDYHEMFEQDVAACIHADTVGYDEVWVGEHYSQQTEPIPNALQFLAYIAPLTRTIKLGTGVLNLPQRHPAEVAGDAAMLDHLTKGRLQLGIGPGGLLSDMELFNTLEGKDRGRMMIESYEAILRIWASDPPYEIKGEHWNFGIQKAVNTQVEQGIMLKPYQKPHPLFAASSISPASSTAKTAGARGWGLISANFNPWCITKTQWAAYEDGAKTAGLVADRKNWRVARSIFVAETDKQAEEYLSRKNHTLRAYFTHMLAVGAAINYMHIFKNRPDMRDEEVTVDYCLKEMVIAGGAETVARKVLDLTDRIGTFGTLVTCFHEWDDKALWMNSMELTARKVIPAVTSKMKSAGMAA